MNYCPEILFTKGLILNTLTTHAPKGFSRTHLHRLSTRDFLSFFPFHPYCSHFPYFRSLLPHLYIFGSDWCMLPIPTGPARMGAVRAEGLFPIFYTFSTIHKAFLYFFQILSLRTPLPLVYRLRNEWCRDSVVRAPPIWKIIILDSPRTTIFHFNYFVTCRLAVMRPMHHQNHQTVVDQGSVTGSRLHSHCATSYLVLRYV